MESREPREIWESREPLELGFLELRVQMVMTGKRVQRVKWVCQVLQVLKE